MVADASSPNLVLKAWKIPSWLLFFYPCWTMETLGLTSEESGSSCRTGHLRQQGGNEGERADRSFPQTSLHLEPLLPKVPSIWKRVFSLHIIFPGNASQTLPEAYLSVPERPIHSNTLTEPHINLMKCFPGAPVFKKPLSGLILCYLHLG